MKRFTGGSFNPEYVWTTAVEFGSKILELDGKKIKLQILDIASEKVFNSLLDLFYTGSHGVFAVYDIT